MAIKLRGVSKCRNGHTWFAYMINYRIPRDPCPDCGLQFVEWSNLEVKDSANDFACTN